MYKVDNAVIMAAGTSSRFCPLSYEKPKALTEVRGEILIERQIRQLHEAGIEEIYLVTGYKKEYFSYLKDKFNVKLIENKEYLTRNNNSSIHAAKDVIRNSYICSSDNYFSENPFEAEVESTYYSTVWADGQTDEWCISENKDGIITDVHIGGEKSWYMLGHVFWSQDFSEKFIKILESEYDRSETASKLWETIYIDHIKELKMKSKHYPDNFIMEFDTLEELRLFDSKYVDDSGSEILKKLCVFFRCSEQDIHSISVLKGKDNEATGFRFIISDREYSYDYATAKIKAIEK